MRWKKGTEERADLVASQKKEAATDLGRMGSLVPSRSAGLEELYSPPTTPCTCGWGERRRNDEGGWWRAWIQW